jgi:hypothetical protein
MLTKKVKQDYSPARTDDLPALCWGLMPTPSAQKQSDSQ